MGNYKGRNRGVVVAYASNLEEAKKLVGETWPFIKELGSPQIDTNAPYALWLLTK